MRNESRVTPAPAPLSGKPGPAATVEPSAQIPDNLWRVDPLLWPDRIEYLVLSPNEPTTKLGVLLGTTGETAAFEIAAALKVHTNSYRVYRVARDGQLVYRVAAPLAALETGAEVVAYVLRGDLAEELAWLLTRPTPCPGPKARDQREVPIRHYEELAEMIKRGLADDLLTTLDILIPDPERNTASKRLVKKMLRRALSEIFQYLSAYDPESGAGVQGALKPDPLLGD